MEGSVGIVRILLGQEEVNLNKKDNRGWTPLTQGVGWCTEEIIIDHRRSPITTYHSYPIGNRFQREKMLEGFGGFNMKSRLGEGSEKRGITHNKAVKERGVRGVAERGMWGKRVV